MNKRLLILLCSISLTLLWGCGSNRSTAADGNETSSVDDGNAAGVTSEAGRTEGASSAENGDEADGTEDRSDSNSERVEPEETQAGDEQGAAPEAATSNASAEAEADAESNAANNSTSTENSADGAPVESDDDINNPTPEGRDDGGDADVADAEDAGEQTNAGADDAVGSETNEANDGVDENTTAGTTSDDTGDSGDDGTQESGNTQPSDPNANTTLDEANTSGPDTEANDDLVGSEADDGDGSPATSGAGEIANEGSTSRDRYPDGPYFPASDTVADLVFEVGGGAPLTLADLRRDENAKVLILYSGVAWCGTCRYHMVQYGEMLERLSSRGLSVLSVVREAFDRSVAQSAFVETYARNNNLTYAVAADPTEGLRPFVDEAQRAQPGAFRISMVIDVESMTLLRIGEFAPTAVEQFIEPLLDAP